MTDVRKSEQTFYRLLMQISVIVVFFTNCSKPSSTTQPPNPPPPTSNFDIVTQTINSINFNSTQTLYGVNNNPSIKVSFSNKKFQKILQNVPEMAFCHFLPLLRCSLHIYIIK